MRLLSLQTRMDDASQKDIITQAVSQRSLSNTCPAPLTIAFRGLQALRRLNMLAKQLRQKRSASGALTLASPEVKFTLDTETLNPMDVGMYQARCP